MVLIPTDSYYIGKDAVRRPDPEYKKIGAAASGHICASRKGTSHCTDVTRALMAAAVVFYDRNSNTIVNPSYPLFRLHSVYIDIVFLFAAASV